MLSKLLNADGYAYAVNVYTPHECETLVAQIASDSAISTSTSAGTRTLLAYPWCRSLARQLREHPLLLPCIGAESVAVQCIYFVKSTACNWLVPFHQDLSIPVASRIDHPELRGWSHKEGIHYVQAPLPILRTMLAVRLHLDPCGPSDGPPTRHSPHSFTRTHRGSKNQQ